MTRVIRTGLSDDMCESGIRTNMPCVTCVLCLSVNHPHSPKSSTTTLFELRSPMHPDDEVTIANNALAGGNEDFTSSGVAPPTKRKKVDSYNMVAAMFEQAAEKEA